jgi:hypothetical protein
MAEWARSAQVRFLGGARMSNEDHTITPAERAQNARNKLSNAIDQISSALGELLVVVGNKHDATDAVSTALERTRVAAAKVDIVIKRVPR